MLVLGAERAGELVVAVRLGVLSLLLERATERVVRVMVGRRQLQHDAELLLRLLVALDAEVRDPERLADRRLARLAPLGLLQGDGRLRGTSLAEVRSSLLEEVVGLGHVALRYGKFSSTKSSGSVKSRVFPISIAVTGSPASIADWKAFSSSYGGRSRHRRSATAGPRPQSGAAVQTEAGSSSRIRTTRAPFLRTPARPESRPGSSLTATAPAAP